ncbi:MAG: cytidylate kinase-like family protein [Lachnospiraceae bacterium]|nr:cytidylate kinase-like family protein [Lachnospiraceae bacterium]
MGRTNQIIITIGRQYGSGGQEIGEKVAKRLGIGFYDKNLIGEAARKSGLPAEILDRSDERTPNTFLAGYITTEEDQVFSAQSDVLRSKADSESFVVVGRCADYILKGLTDTLNVFIYAPKRERMKRVKDYLRTNDEWTVRRAIDQTDGKRKNYYNYFSGEQWGSPESYHLMIDSSLLGIDGTVDLIVDAAKTYFKFI